LSTNQELLTFCAGEIHELKEELASLDKGKKKEAVKKVIAAMTVGKDVSMLFPAVVNNMQTEDLELKKLVYLYLINYAKTQPDLAIMAVNTFVKARRGSHGSSAQCRAGVQRALSLIGVQQWSVTPRA
jgi:AP-1 complex subunit beta-1